MIAVLQRVARAQVSVGGEVVGEIGRGMLVLAAAIEGDTDADVDALAKKIIEYRIFEDEAGKMNRSVAEVGGSILVVSQFTLAADGEQGRRPSFDRAAKPAEARARVDRLVAAIASTGLRVETGRFGADMEVTLVNTGPATFILERRKRVSH